MKHGISKGTDRFGQGRALIVPRTPEADFLAYLERRGAETRRRFDDLARRRASRSPQERTLAHESLRSEAAELGSELRRLKLAAAITRALLSDPLSHPLARPIAGVDR
jgi:hypothetical protein